VFQWLSKFFYKDLMVERVMCVVATGYAPPVVSTLSLVQYFKSQLLQPLSPEEAGQALAPYNFPAGLANQLAEMAAGHPGSLMEGATSTKALLDEDKPEMFSETGALSRKGQAKVANAMAETLLQNIPANLARCCRLIAPLRTFRYDTLAALLPALLPVDPKYGRASVVDYMLLGKELNDQVDFIESDKTYVMHPIARAILSNALKYSDPTGSEAFRQVNEEAANYYAGLAERLERPEQRSDAVLEEIYHRLVLAHLEAETHQRPIQAELNQLVQVLKQRMPLLGGFEGSRRLASLLEADRDFQRLFPNEVDGLLQMLYESRLR
jgi:hypothetical protein